MNIPGTLILLVVVLVTTLKQTECENKTCTERYTLIPGPTPRDGRDGIQGEPGRPGDKGDRGDIGPPGPKGDQGDNGSIGTKGNQGDIGPTGSKGDRGDIGPTGSKGDRGDIGPTGTKGNQGDIGPTGSKGDRGNIGPAGQKGDQGSTVITEEDVNRVTNNVTAKINESIIAELQDTIQTLNQTLTDRLLHLESRVFVTLCNITSANWRRIAYFDTTQGDSCPTGLRTFTNTTTNQTACGTTSGGPVRISLNFSTGGEYTNICGRVRGYEYGTTVAFYHHGQRYQTIDTNYVDGISITKGSPRQHLWTYASGLSERLNSAYFACPCARSNYDSSWIPEFVGNNYYCESGFVDNWVRRIAWEDPLWDGQGCFASNNTCCDHYGWFHRQVPPSSDDIEVRWCKYYSSVHTDILTDQLEIWVM